ncbi:tail fiber protein [Salmonella enterica subsp. enterica serovar Chester]
MLTPVHSQFAQQAPSQKAGIMPFTTVFCIFINLGLGETANLAAGALQKDQNGADIPDTALFRQSIGVYDASTSQKGLVRLNGGVTDESNETAATSGAVKVAYDAAIAAADIAKTKWSAVDATIYQKGIVMLSDNTGVPDSTTAATTTAVNYVLNQAASAYSLAESKYTAGGATTGKAGLVQLVNSMGSSGSLVMPQAAVTTAIQSYPSLGKGQTLQDLRGSRSIDATYTNSTGFPIAVYVRIAGGTSANLYVHVNGIEFGGGGSIASNTSIATAFFIVPNGATYRVMASGSSIALQAWSELR